MSAVLLKNLPRPPEKISEPWTPPPRCEADVVVTGMHDRAWRMQRYGKEPYRCTRDAVVEISGRRYCRLHGGYVALDMLLAGPGGAGPGTDGGI